MRRRRKRRKNKRKRKARKYAGLELRREGKSKEDEVSK